jgi:hypothetical protein
VCNRISIFLRSRRDFGNRVAQMKLVEPSTFVTLQTAHHGSTSSRFASTKTGSCFKASLNRLLQQNLPMTDISSALHTVSSLCMNHSFHVKEKVTHRQLQQVFPL